MNPLSNPTTYQSDIEHVFSLFYEIKQAHPFVNDSTLMGMLNKITGWEYPSNMKMEYKEAVLREMHINHL